MSLIIKGGNVMDGGRDHACMHVCMYVCRNYADGYAYVFVYLCMGGSLN